MEFQDEMVAPYIPTPCLPIQPACHGLAADESSQGLWDSKRRPDIATQ